MKRISVNSSNILEVGYDTLASTLEIVFTDGRVYQYFDVPERVHSDLLQAPSAGQYFNSEIRGVYRFSRV